MPTSTEEIRQEDFAAYVAVQESGITNMFAVNVVSQLSGLDRDTILYIMNHYQYLVDLYPDVKNGRK